MHVNAAAFSKQLTNQNQSLPKKLDVLRTFEEVHVGRLFASRMENTLRGVGRINVAELNFACHSGVSQQSRERGQIFAVDQAVFSRGSVKDFSHRERCWHSSKNGFTRLL